MSPPFLRLWGWPIALAVATVAGLVVGLLDDGLHDLLAWVALGVPLAIGIAHSVRR